MERSIRACIAAHASSWRESRRSSLRASSSASSITRRFLRDFFADIQRAIDQSNGEVYQYVGDEVVILWPARRASGRWLDCFSGMCANIAAKRPQYLRGRVWIDRSTSAPGLFLTAVALVTQRYIMRYPTSWRDPA